MKHIFYTAAACIMAALTWACTQNESSQMPELQISSSSAGVTVSEDGQESSISLGAQGGSAQISIESNCRWNIEAVSGNWCAVEISDNSITVSAGENPQSTSREARISITASNSNGSVSSTVNVEQAAAGESSFTYTLEEGDTEVIFPEEGGSYRIEVSSTEGWTAVSDASWFSVETDGNGVTLTAGKNNNLNMATGNLVIMAGDGGENNTAIIPVSQFSSVNAMVIEVTVVDSSGRMAALPFENTGVINCLVDWGDGSLTRVYGAWPKHQYEETGVYDIRIIGKVSSFRANQIPEFDFPYRDAITAIKDWGNIGIESLKNAFYQCRNLKSIAAPDEDSFELLTTIYQAFYQNTSLESIPEGMFADLPLLNEAYAAFSGCESLTEVPARMFAGSSNITRFFRLFWRCYSLQTIAPDAFEGCTSAEDFGQVFYQTPIGSIPEGLFLDCTSADGFANAFNGCESLTSIPAKLFPNSVNNISFASVFANCTSLTEIPEDLFANSPTAVNLSSAFNGCTSLASVPEGIFAGLTAVTNFNSTFLNCSSLTGVPASLFDDCLKVTNFGKTFSGCTSLTGESPYTVIDGVKYHLYERENHDSFSTVKTTADCFSGCTGLTDYSTIETSHPDWL